MLEVWANAYRRIATAEELVDYVTRFWDVEDAMKIIAMMGSPVEVQHLLATHPSATVRIVLAAANGTSPEVGEILKKDQELAVRWVASEREDWAVTHVTLPAPLSAGIVDCLFNRSKRDALAAMTGHPEILSAYADHGDRLFYRLAARLAAKLLPKRPAKA